MQCSVCKTRDMKQVSLESNLLAYQCEQCGSLWIASSDYWAWLDHRGQVIAETPVVDSSEHATDDEHAKVCPGCGHILSRYRVAHDIDFVLEQCSHCNSFWLDMHKWNILKERQLHDSMQKVFTEPWQRRLRQEETKRRWQGIYTEKFGEGDYAEIQRIRAWIHQHPERHRLLAYLNNDDPYSNS